MESEELTVSTGDLVQIEEENESGWSRVTRQVNGVLKEGWLPSNYLEKI